MAFVGCVCVIDKSVTKANIFKGQHFPIHVLVNYFVNKARS